MKNLSPTSILLLNWCLILICAAQAQAAEPPLKGTVSSTSKTAPSLPASKNAAAGTLVTSAYGQGVHAYQAARYNEAVAYMYDAIMKEKAGANAWLYMGNSYYAMGQKKRAIETYESIKTRFPGTAQAVAAAQYLQRLNPVTTAAKPGDAKDAAAGADGAGDKEAKMTPAAVLAGLRQRMKIIRPSYGRTEVTSRTIAAVDGFFEKIPPRVREILYKNDIKFEITPTMIDKYPEGAYQEVAGYEGGTSKSCPGLFDNGTIVLSQATVNESTDEVNKPRKVDDLEGTFLHETGHALDHCLDWYSRSKEFRHNYYLDIARVPDDVAPRISYFLQKSDAGQIESCAELTSILLGNNRGKDAELTIYFPNTLSFIRKKLGL